LKDKKKTMTLLEFLLLLSVAGATGTGAAALVAALLGMIGRDQATQPAHATIPRPRRR
jgi:hypothetical protein